MNAGVGKVTVVGEARSRRMRGALTVTGLLLSGSCLCQPPLVPSVDGGVGGGAAGGAGGSASQGGGTAGGAGPEVDGGLLECIAAANRGVPGEPCGFTRGCAGDDFACSEGAVCVDGGLQLFRRCRPCLGRYCSDAGTLSCAARAGTRVTGDTPLGSIDLRGAWGSFCFCLSRGVIIQLGNTPSAEWRPAESLGFDLVWFDPETDGGYPATVRLVLDGGTAIAPATVGLRPIEGTHLQGTLTITAPGWNVSGSFDAELCDQLRRSGS